MGGGGSDVDAVVFGCSGILRGAFDSLTPDT